MPVGFLSRVPAQGTDAPPVEVYAFGPFVLDVARHALTRDGRPVTLAPKTFELLLLLVRSGGRVVSRQELVAALWPDTFVEEGSLSFQMSSLRRALGGATSDAAASGDGADTWIETVPKLGYRFRAAVTPGSARAVGSRRRLSVGSVTAVTAVGAALVAGAIAWTWTYRSSPPAPRSLYGTTAVPLTSYPGWEGSPSLSPDGTQVAFHWNGRGSRRLQRIYVKLVGEGEPLQVTNDPRRDMFPAWSPDGRRLAFLRSPYDGTPWHLIVMPALGGTERLVASLFPIWFLPSESGDDAAVVDARW